MGVTMEMCVWLMEHQTKKDDLSSVGMTSGGLCAILTGLEGTLVSRANS